MEHRVLLLLHTAQFYNLNVATCHNLNLPKLPPQPTTQHAPQRRRLKRQRSHRGPGHCPRHLRQRTPPLPPPPCHHTTNLSTGNPTARQGPHRTHARDREGRRYVSTIPCIPPFLVRYAGFTISQRMYANVFVSSARHECFGWRRWIAQG
jgi:hypothetical protein